MKIQGPVIPIPVPFTDSLEVDYQGLRKYISFLASKGIKNVMTTIGTSRYNLLSWEECEKVNEAVAEVARKENIISIVANPPSGDLTRAVHFAKHAESINADFYLIFYPDRHYGEDNTFEFFEEVNKHLTHTLGLIHEMPMRNGMGGGSIQYSVNLLERILRLEKMAGMKEEALDLEYSNELMDRFGGEMEMIGAGGGMSRYLYRDFERKSATFLGGIGNFYPELELDFYNNIQNGKMEEAKQIVEEIEKKYFDLVVPIGWHPSLKIALNLFGLLPANERSPMKKVSGEERKIMDQFFVEQAWK